MAHTPQTRQAAENALSTYVRATGGGDDDRTTQITDLIADLLLLLPDDGTAEQVSDRAYAHSQVDREGV